MIDMDKGAFGCRLILVGMIILLYQLFQFIPKTGGEGYIIVLGVVIMFCLAILIASFFPDEKPVFPN